MIGVFHINIILHFFMEISFNNNKYLFKLLNNNLDIFKIFINKLLINFNHKN